MIHAIIGENLQATIYQEYLENTSCEVFKLPSILSSDNEFGLGFICEEGTVNQSIELLAPRCKVLVTPKLETFKDWSDVNNVYPGCQFVMAKSDIYRPQVEMLHDIRQMKDIIHDIEIFWDNIIGLLHIAHVVAGPLGNPIFHNDTMTFKNFGIKTHCEEADYNEIRINFRDGSVSTHSFISHNKNADHAMIQDLFRLTKFNPGEYHKHFILDRFVHLLLE